MNHFLFKGHYLFIIGATRKDKKAEQKVCSTKYSKVTPIKNIVFATNKKKFHKFLAMRWMKAKSESLWAQASYDLSLYFLA